MDVRVEPPMMDNRIYGVAGRKQDLQVRLPLTASSAS